MWQAEFRSRRNTFRDNIALGCLYLLICHSPASADTNTSSFHLGYLHPSGVDLIGYTNEKRITQHLYRFYTFGFPSIAAAGFNYYSHYGNNGLTSSFGVGIGSVAYVSMGYQWKLGVRSNIKLGAGFTTGIAYTGSYPVLSYERHFSAR